MYYHIATKISAIWLATRNLIFTVSVQGAQYDNIALQGKYEKKFKMADWQSPPENQLKRHVLVWVTAALLIKWKVNLGNFPTNSETGPPQQTHQLWINVETTLIVNVHQRFSTLIFGWKWKLSQRTFIHVFSTLAKQRW